jgi:outer membrane immunogenic protein
MRRHIYAILAVAAAALATQIAGALAQEPVWGGAYIGAYAGSAQGASTVGTVVECPPGGGYLCDDNIFPENGLLIGATATGTASASVFTGGAFAGHDWQQGGVVYGVEGDFGSMPFHLTVGGSASHINGGIKNDGVPAVFTINTTASTDWLATARFRLGFLPAPSLLVYATAGVAATALTVSNSYADDFTSNGGMTGSVGSSSTKALRAGLVLGAGAEWELATHWRLRAEYLHAEFGSVSTTHGVSYYALTDLNPITSTADLRADIVRIGVAYRF